MNRDQPVRTLADLLDYFVQAETPVSEFAIGTEHEKVAIYQESRERVPYEGPRAASAPCSSASPWPTAGNASSRVRAKTRS